MEREQLLKVMVPVGALALLLILVGAVIALNSGGGTPTNSATPPPPDGSQTPEMPGAPTSSVAKYDFPLDGPEWKEVAGRPGLKLWDVKVGTGAECLPGTSVTAQYTGWRVDGFSFDNPQKHGGPQTFSLNQVVAGWTHGLPGMKVGGVRRLFIPSALGYGAQNKGRDIPPHTDLIFEVELVGVR